MSSPSVKVPAASLAMLDKLEDVVFHNSTSVRKVYRVQPHAFRLCIFLIPLKVLEKTVFPTPFP